MMDLLRELNYEAAKRARMASRTATDAADSDDESECSSSAPSVAMAGSVGSIDVHDSSDSSVTEQSVEVQGVAHVQRLQHSELQATQVSVSGVCMVRTHGRATLLCAATSAMQVTRMVQTTFQHPHQPGPPALLLVTGLSSKRGPAAAAG